MSYATPNVGTANNWVYYGVISTAEQVSSDYTFPGTTGEPYAIVGVGFRISGYNGDKGYFRGAVWNNDSGRGTVGTLLGYSGASTPASSTAGSSPYFSYVDVNFTNNALVYGGQNLMVGFWRKSDSSSYTTAWAFDTAQSSTTIWYDNSAASLGSFTKNSTPYTTATICLHTAYVTRPGAPGTPSVTSGNGQVSLSWSAASAGGGTITSYGIDYQSSTNGGSTWSGWTNFGTSTVTSVTVTGLTNGTLYRFRVHAFNQVTSLTSSTYYVWSGTSASVTPYGTPGAPTSLTISSPSANNASLYWTAPAVTGGGTLTYTVKYTTDSTFKTGIQTLTGQSLATSGSPLVISGLNGGTIYYFRVSAVNTGKIEGTYASGSVTIVAPASEVLLKFNSFSTAVIGYTFTGYSPATYRIYYKLSSDSTYTLAASGVTSTEYRLCGLNSNFINNTYNIYVEAWSAAPALLATTPVKTITIGSTPSTPNISTISYNTSNYSYATSSNDIVVLPLTVTISESDTNVIYGHQFSLDNGVSWNDIEQTTFPIKINSMIVTSKDTNTWYVDLRFTSQNLPSYTTIGIRGFCDDTTLKFSGFNTPIGTTYSCTKTMVGADTNIRFEILKSAVPGITATTYTDGTHFTSYIIPYPSRLVTFDISGLKPSIIYPIQIKSIGFTTKSDVSNVQNFKMSPVGLAYSYDPLANSSSGGWLPRLIRKWNGSSWIIKLAQKYNGSAWVNSSYAEDIPGVSYVSYPRNYTAITAFDSSKSNNDIIEFRLDANIKNFENDVLDGGNWNGN